MVWLGLVCGYKALVCVDDIDTWKAAAARGEETLTDLIERVMNAHVRGEK